VHNLKLALGGDGGSFLGDIMKPYYQDSAVTIYHGDCREIVSTLGKFDLLLTDPPYGLGENAHRVASSTKLAKTTDYGSFDWDSKPASKDLIDLSIAACSEAIIWGGNYFPLAPMRGWLVWDKLNSGNFADAELAWTNCKTSVRIFKFMWNGMIRAGEARGVKRVHPAQKPVELLTWCISKANNPRTILDTFAGSCTTGRAAKNLGIKCVCIEREERYCEVGVKRMQQEVLNLTT
jgi:DNA modification methylase